jgi:hypothetical protein
MKKQLYKLFFIAFMSFSFYNCSTSEISLEELEPVIERIAYTTDVKTIIDANCISCHVSGGQASFLPLVNYNQVKNEAEFGNLINSMNDALDPMPQSGLLSLQTRAIVEKWRADGFLEN